MLLSASFRRGLRDGFPILIAVGSLGVVFGILAIEAGFTGWIAVLASVVVVSGAAQFTLVGLAGAGIAPILVATAGLALRHVPMSAKLSELVRDRSRTTRLALAWVLVDETFGLTLAAADRGEPDLVAYKTAADRPGRLQDGGRSHALQRLGGGDDRRGGGGGSGRSIRLGG